MSGLVKGIYLLGLVIPFLYLGLLVSAGMLDETGLIGEYARSVGVHIAYFVVYIGYVIAYIIHMWRNPNVGGRTGWLIGLLLLTWPVMLAYWIKYIRVAQTAKG